MRWRNQLSSVLQPSPQKQRLAENRDVPTLCLLGHQTTGGPSRAQASQPLAIGSQMCSNRVAECCWLMRAVEASTRMPCLWSALATSLALREWLKNIVYVADPKKPVGKYWKTKQEQQSTTKSSKNIQNLWCLGLPKASEGFQTWTASLFWAAAMLGGGWGDGATDWHSDLGLAPFDTNSPLLATLEI